jgi:hypothetical protein
MGPPNISFSPVHYIFLEITFPLLPDYTASNKEEMSAGCAGTEYSALTSSDVIGAKSVYLQPGDLFMFLSTLSFTLPEYALRSTNDGDKEFV